MIRLDVKIEAQVGDLLQSISTAVGGSLLASASAVMDPSTRAVASGATATLWSASTSPVTALGTLFVLASADTELEFADSKGGYNHAGLKAGVPFILGTGVLRRSGSAFSGAVDVIDSVAIKNTGASPLTVRCLVIST